MNRNIALLAALVLPLSAFASDSTSTRPGDALHAENKAERAGMHAENKAEREADKAN